ncbi:hypothetical protein INR49_006179, partial [Caranx melampygus]
ICVAMGTNGGGKLLAALAHRNFSNRLQRKTTGGRVQTCVYMYRECLCQGTMSLSKPLRDFPGQQLEGGVSVAVKHNKLSVFLDIQKKRREEEELTAAIEERKQNLQSLQQRLDELHKDHDKLLELHTSFDMFLKFKDVNALTEYMESLIHCKEQLAEREQRAQEQVDLMRKEIGAVKNQHQFLQMQRNNQLTLLKTELDDTCAEALLLERQWNHIQETAAKKTLQLGQIKIATFNLYEMICYGLGEEEDVWMNDTEKQLEKIQVVLGEVIVAGVVTRSVRIEKGDENRG